MLRVTAQRFAKWQLSTDIVEKVWRIPERTPLAEFYFLC
jgi:hypothetical protein